MKICIYGAGAVGGHFAARLAQAGEDVCIIARGPHLDAVQQNGLKLLLADEIEQQGLQGPKTMILQSTFHAMSGTGVYLMTR